MDILGVDINAINLERDDDVWIYSTKLGSIGTLRFSSNSSADSGKGAIYPAFVVDLADSDLLFDVEVAETYTVSTTVNDSNMGSVTGGGSFAKNTPTTLKAIPEEGYHLTGWEINGTDSGITSESICITQVNSNISYKAIFARDLLDKGDVITFNNDNTKKYRVLKMIDGDKAFVVGLFNAAGDSRVAYEKDLNNTVHLEEISGQQMIKYDGSSLDTLLNTTWYNSLPDGMKSGIVDQNIVQNIYDYSVDESTPNYMMKQTVDPYTLYNTNIRVVLPVGERHVFALDIKDIADYIGNRQKACKRKWKR